MELRGLVVVEDPCKDANADASVSAAERIANRPIVHHVLDALEAAGIRDVIVASSEGVSEHVRSCVLARDTPLPGSVRFVSQPGPVQLATAVGLAAPLIGRAPCLVHAADGLLTETLTSIAGTLDGSPDAILAVHQSPSPEQRLTEVERKLLRLAELDPSRTALGVAGVWALGPGAVERVAASQGSGSGQDARTTPGPGLDITAIAECIGLAGGSIRVRPVDAWRAYRGRATDLLELNRVVLDGIAADLPQGVGDTNRIEGRVSIHETAFVTDSVIVGPAVIGPGASISDAYIGPYTAIGASCRIEGAEIERSIVSPEARVSHIGSRITDSIVGQGAHLFRDFSMPRALRVRVGADAELGLC